MKNEDLPLGVILARTKRELFRVLRKRTEQSADVSLSHEQFGLLLAISRNEQDVVQQDMAVFFGKNKSSILRLIDSLEEKNLIRRIVDSVDHRKKCLVVTNLGRSVIKHYLGIEFGLVSELQKGLKKSEIDAFYKVMDTMRINASKL